MSSDPKRLGGLIWVTAATLVALAVMLGLGVWQLQRLHWKEHLIAQIAERIHAPAVAAAPLLASAEDSEYSHVTVTGRYHHQWERYLFANGQSDWGWDVFTPLELPDGRLLLINRGYVPRQSLDRASRATGLPPGEVTITGLLRRAPGAKPWWTPAGDVAKGQWYWPEIAAMVASLPAGPVKITDYYVDSDPVTAAAPPVGGSTNIVLPNRHLEYALTWFSLAATLAVIYAIAVVRRLRAARG